MLVVDASAAHYWNGVDSGDYDQACKLFDHDDQAVGFEIPVGHKQGLLWELNGPGLVYVLDAEPGLCLVRAWLKEGANEELTMLELARIEQTMRTKQFGCVSNESGRLAIMWAVENGDIIASALALGLTRDNTDAYLDDSTLVIDVYKGVLSAACDVVETERGKALRLFLT